MGFFYFEEKDRNFTYHTGQICQNHTTFGTDFIFMEIIDA